MKCYPFNPKITKKDLEQAQAVSNAFWNACSMALINEKERKMATVKYDDGDILTLCEDGHCYATAVIFNSYMSGYDLFIKPKGNDNFRFIRDVPEMVLCKYEVVGHIDISGMSRKEIETELVYAIATVWSECAIAYAVQTHWELMKLREPKEENEYMKKEFYIPKVDDSFCCNSCDKFEKENDRLKRENERLKEEFGSASNKIFGLKREIDSLRNNYNDTEARISRNLHNLGFTSDAVYKIMYSD